uniref:FtsX-like permease family protein n=1 Tax=Marinobacter sp. TaxID=50741 RepID=UPI0035C68B0F
KDFAERSTNFWLFESGMGTAFGVSSLIALAVAIVITSQTLMAAVSASIREYATLRALGAPGRLLRGIVLQQAFWVGLAGVALAGLAVLGIAALSGVGHRWVDILAQFTAPALLAAVTALALGLLIAGRVWVGRRFGGAA